MVAHQVQAPVGLAVETVVGNGTSVFSGDASLDNLYPALVQVTQHVFRVVSNLLPVFRHHLPRLHRWKVQLHQRC